ncbi:MAG: hypothetical protein CSA26_01620 [Desulfobacterales bacterium]|nr:MAG: hypothetical protein CSA26_01620 [Desulfobacterales bacterium]
MNNWYKMKKYDFISFVVLIVLCVIAFIPFSWDTMVAGMALFGWVQGVLMLLAPAVTLFFISLEKSEEGDSK